MTGIKGVGGYNPTPSLDAAHGGRAEAKSSGFGRFMSKVADSTLGAAAVVAPFMPGGQLVSAAVSGLRELRGQSPDGLSGAAGDQLDKMWAMQRENQVFNLQYMALQNEVQSENRRFSTLSNLMKARHDTAKAAINNMHA